MFCFFCTSLLWIRSYICYHSQTDGPVWAKLPLLNWLTHLFFSSYAIVVSMTANTQVLAVAKKPPKKTAPHHCTSQLAWNFCLLVWCLGFSNMLCFHLFKEHYFRSVTFPFYSTLQIKGMLLFDIYALSVILVQCFSKCSFMSFDI